MHIPSPALLLPLLLSLPTSSLAAETILGVYIFSRHGDRTPKATPPSNLTDLGYAEVFTSGSYFRSRYISSSAPSRIQSINPDLVKNSQLAASAPVDVVLLNSAQGFLQGLYPPVGAALSNQGLSNGSTVPPPLNGYQLIPVYEVASGADSEDSAWLQGSTGCAKATISSNEYYASKEFLDLNSSTAALYQSVAPLVNGTFPASQMSYQNAYSIWDVINVAEIHNASFPASLPPATLAQLFTLASTHEYNLAFNASDSVRAISGAVLAAQILAALNTTITATAPAHSPRLNIQFGAYAAFFSFFGLAQLPQLPDIGPQFTQIPDYASTMTFELFTNATVNASGPFPAAGDLMVRFLWHNGTTTNGSEPVAVPLFGGNETELSWGAFAQGMGKIAVGTQGGWCAACGNDTGVCAAASSSSSGSAAGGPSASGSGKGDGGGMSRAVAGVVGAMVTLAVVLGLEVLVLLLGGLRIVRKRKSGAASPTTAAATGTKA